MADRTIDELLAAIESIQGLKQTLFDHDVLFGQIGDRLAQIELRLSALEAKPRPRRVKRP